MKWKKLGSLYEVKGNRHPKLATHAANPLPVHLEGEVYRIFYSGRDSNNRSSVGAVDFNIVRREVVQDHYRPFAECEDGTYFRDGISVGCCYESGGLRYIGFMGWQTAGLSHWRGDIGRIQLGDDFSLKHKSKMSISGDESISFSYPFVVGPNMYYGATKSWDVGNGEMLHTINRATTIDGGTSWQYAGLAVPYELNIAQAFSRPCVTVSDKGVYEMWFSYRGGARQKYRIGYARSEDGASWTLDLASAGIDVTPSSWDSEMIEYPYVFDHNGQRYMLYNGNGYGKTGFGLAVLE